MCKTLQCTWRVTMLVLGVVYQVNATPSPPVLAPQIMSDYVEHKLYPTKRIKCRDQMTKALPDPRLLDSVKLYLEVIDHPFSLSPTPYLFIDALKNRTTRSLIRNGDLDSLEAAYLDYQATLTELRAFSKMHKIPIHARRRTSFKSRGREPNSWRSFLKLRKQLWTSFYDFRFKLLSAYHTERLIWAQYSHNPRLYQAINSLINLNGKPLPVYVYTRHALFHEDPGLQHLAGMLVVSLNEGIFSSDTPVIRSCHPTFVGRTGALVVFVDTEADGATLSHEFGHLYYLYHHWERYMKFVAFQGEHYQVGGHGHGDDSGRAANLAEAGKMPDLYMPWTYRRQWAEVAQLLMTLAGK